MSAIDVQHTIDRRVFAAALELIPFFSLIAFAGETNAALVSVAAVIVSGIGWLSLGRWRGAVAIFTTRFAVLAFAGPFALFWLYGVGMGCSPDCSAVDTVVGGGPMLIVMAAAYLVPLWSSAMILRGKSLIRV
jgi:hypothetical protein